MQKDAKIRLGSPYSPYGEISENIFFRDIDWRKLERKQLETPFKPNIVCVLTGTNHCKICFVSEEIELGAILYTVRGLGLVTSCIFEFTSIY